MIDLVRKRRSIRKYKDILVEKNKIEKLLKVASLAPSSMNKKPVEFIVVDDKEIILNLQECKKFGTTALKTAPLAIVIVADKIKSDVWVEDASIAATFIMLEAEKLGLGSNWIQLRNRESNEGISEETTRKLLKIQDNFGVLAIITIGYKDEEKAAYDDVIQDKSKVHYNNFNELYNT